MKTFFAIVVLSLSTLAGAQEMVQVKKPFHKASGHYIALNSDDHAICQSQGFPSAVLGTKKELKTFQVDVLTREGTGIGMYPVERYAEYLGADGEVVESFSEVRIVGKILCYR